MRTIISDRVKYLSIQLDCIPGIQPALKAFVIRSVAADKSIGIKSDRRVFQTKMPKDSTYTDITKLLQYL